MKKYILIICILSLTQVFAQLGSGKYTAKNLESVNTENSDFGPSFLGADKLVYTSPRRGFNIIRDVWEPNGQRFLDLYVGSIREGGEITDKKRLQGEVNTKYHEGNAVFSKDGKTVYFTRNNYYQKKLGINNAGETNLAMFKAMVNNEGEWINIIPMPFNNVEYSVGHPALSEDGKTLYFASDMPGSLGETDIYKVEVNESGFGNPVNLGPKVNSSSKDWFPFVDGEVLYFTSDRSGGKGGSDIYASKLTGFSTEPVLLNEPINTSANDFAFIIDKESRKGYFSSNREGGKGDDDIYSFVEEETVEFKCKQLIVGEVIDKNSGDFIADADVVLKDKDNKVLETVKTDKKGNFSVEVYCETEYQLEGKKTEYTPQVKDFTTSSVGDEELKMRILLGKGEIDFIVDANGNKVPRNSQDEVEDIKPEGLPDVLPEEIVRLRPGAYAVNIDPIYFDLNSSYLSKQAKRELDKVVDLMKKNPKMVIESGSHTDSQGIEGYNLWLSGRRANSTVDYIIKRGIDPSRITGKGYGETQLLNGCDDNTECTDAQHAINRRTEFLIIRM